MNDFSAGVRKTFEENYEGLMMTTVHMHDAVVSGNEDFGIKIYCERPVRTIAP